MIETPLYTTWEEFFALPGEHLFAEWIDGAVRRFEPVDERHQDTLGFLMCLLSLHVAAHQLGRVMHLLFLMRLTSVPSGRMPDLMFFTNENKKNLTNYYYDGPADLVVEIVSPDTEHREKVEKFVEYERAGVREYWLVDYTRHDTTFYQRDLDGKFQRVLADKNGLYESAVIKGFWLNTNWLWQEPEPFFEALQQLGLTG